MSERVAIAKANRPLSIVRLEKAVEMLDHARTLDDIKKVVHVAAAAELWARKAKLGLEAQNMAAEVKLRAERKAGELLKKLKRGKANQHTKRAASNVGRSTSEYGSALKEAAATRQDANRWEQASQIPEQQFKAYVEHKQATGKEISTSDFLRTLGREVNRKKRAEKLAEVSRASVELDGSLGRFPVIYADPPWRYEHAESESRAIENQYPTMELEAICSLNVASCTTDDAILFCWATSPKLAEALQVITRWGFTYRSSMVWDKEIIGNGYYARQQHELLLIATKGEPPTPPPEARPSSVYRERRGKHSAKPERFYELIEAMYPELPKLELFCRKPRAGWAAWGNESAA